MMCCYLPALIVEGDHVHGLVGAQAEALVHLGPGQVHPRVREDGHTPESKPAAPDRVVTHWVIFLVRKLRIILDMRCVGWCIIS